MHHLNAGQYTVVYSSCNIYLGILKIKIDPAALLLSSDPSIHEATTIVQNSWQNSGKVFAFVGCMRGGGTVFANPGTAEYNLNRWGGRG